MSGSAGARGDSQVVIVVGLLLLALVIPLSEQWGALSEPQRAAATELSITPRAAAAFQAGARWEAHSLNARYEPLLGCQVAPEYAVSGWSSSPHMSLLPFALSVYMLYFLLPTFNTKYKKWRPFSYGSII